MATDSARLTGMAADPPAPKGGRGATSLQTLRDQPFFSDKNRAFWILQSAGWTGYFVLRSLNGVATAQGPEFVFLALLLTATGYSLTLLMGSAFRRLIRLKPLVTWPATVAIVLTAAVLSAVIATAIAATVAPSAVPLPLPVGLPVARAVIAPGGARVAVAVAVP